MSLGFFLLESLGLMAMHPSNALGKWNLCHLEDSGAALLVLAILGLFFARRIGDGLNGATLKSNNFPFPQPIKVILTSRFGFFCWISTTCAHVVPYPHAGRSVS